VKVRRVVTGQDPSGKSVFVSGGGHTRHAEARPRVWSLIALDADQTPKLPSDGTPLSQNRYFPRQVGRWVICTLPPNSVGELETRDLEALRNDI
jgi:hypothetical protein